MACKNCRDFNDNSCTDTTTTNCVSSMADPVEELDICLNDSLTWVINKITEKMKELLLGQGILLDDLDLSDCEFIGSFFTEGEEKDLLNVLDAYKQAICNLKEQVDINTADIAAFTEVSLYTLECLTVGEDPCTGVVTFQMLIQAIITQLCALTTQLEGIAEGLLASVEEIAGNMIVGGSITSCGGNGISFSGSGATAVATFQALVPPYCPIIYTGSLALFGATGIGLANTAMCGWYLCNGNNGTPNSSTLPQNGGGTIQYIIRFT